MTPSGRRVPPKIDELDEKDELRKMFIEYREENSRDMAREASGEW